MAIYFFRYLHKLPQFLIFISLTLGLRSAWAQAPAGPHRPATVPAGYVVTPFGYSHPSCVKQLAEGDTQQLDRGIIQHADRSIESIQPCSYPRYTAKGEVIAKRETTDVASGIEPPSISHSYIEFAEAFTSTSYGELAAEWNVPPAPTSNDGQTVYFFPGMQDDGNTITIIQPVLGWQNGAWTIASWNCCYNNVSLYSTPQTVYPGNAIEGLISSTCAAGTISCPTWNITTSVVNTSTSTQLANTSSYGQTFNWALGGALEVYDIAQCSDYPPNGSLTFFYEELYDNSFNPIANPGWSVVNAASGETPQCNYGAQASGDEVTVDYGTLMTATPYTINETWAYAYPNHSAVYYTFTLEDSTPNATINYTISTTDSCGGVNETGGTGVSGGQVTTGAIPVACEVNVTLDATAPGYQDSAITEVTYQQ
jgi:hypothetical protein